MSERTGPFWSGKKGKKNIWWCQTVEGIWVCFSQLPHLYGMWPCGSSSVSAQSGATCLLRLESGCSHAGCLYSVVSLLWWESQGDTCHGGFLPTSKTFCTEGTGREALVRFSPLFPLWYIGGFCHLGVSPAFLWCLQRQGRS